MYLDKIRTLRIKRRREEWGVEILERKVTVL